jgi:hypothetical protein
MLESAKLLLSAIKIDGDAVRGYLDELVRSTVEETLNKRLDAESDKLLECSPKTAP